MGVILHRISASQTTTSLKAFSLGLTTFTRSRSRSFRRCGEVAWLLNGRPYRRGLARGIRTCTQNPAPTRMRVCDYDVRLILVPLVGADVVPAEIAPDVVL